MFSLSVNELRLLRCRAPAIPPARTPQYFGERTSHHKSGIASAKLASTTAGPLITDEQKEKAMLIHNQNRPTRAGMAEIVYCDPAQLADGARREGTTILVPDTADLEVVELLDGQQYLFHKPPTNPRFDRGAGVWFGGMDESPFLASLITGHYRAYRQGGEAAFFASLKPMETTYLEVVFGCKAKRQGDIFAMPIEDMDLAATVLGQWNRESLHDRGNWPSILEEFGASIFGTRHRFYGKRYAELPANTIHAERFCLVWDGVLRAPDHRPLELPGLHYMQQAQGLINPTKAD